MSALRNPPGYERGRGDLARALRRSLKDAPYTGQPKRGWRLLSRTRREAALIARQGSEWGLMRFVKHRRRGWEWSGSGGCRPRAWREGLEAVPWTVETPPAADARQVAVLIDEQSCAPGRPLAPWVHYGPERITVTYHLELEKGNFTCEGRPPLRVVLELEEQVGSRTLVDGGAPPRA